MLGVASGLGGWGGPGSLARSGMEADAMGGQVVRAMVAAGVGQGLAWVSLGRRRASAGMGSGAVGATAVGKKFSRLSLGCLGVVGVSPAACKDKRGDEEGWPGSPETTLSHRMLSGPRTANTALRVPCSGPSAANEAHQQSFGVL